MRKQFVQCETYEQAEIECPWASEVVKVEGGYQCFDSMVDAEIFQAQI